MRTQNKPPHNEARSKAIEIHEILSAIGGVSELAETFRLHSNGEQPLDAELIDNLTKNGRITGSLNSAISHLAHYVCFSVEAAQNNRIDRKTLLNHTFNIDLAAGAIVTLADLAERFRANAAGENDLDEDEFTELAAHSGILGALAGAIEYLTRSASVVAEWLSVHAIQKEYEDIKP